MGKTQHNAAPDQETDSTMKIDASLSTDTKRQREDTDATSVFGKRTMGSDLVFMEGVLPSDSTNQVNDDSIESQAAACFDRLESMLARRDLTLADVMKIEIHLTDPDTATAVDRVYESRFEEYSLPPRTVIGVCALPNSADIQLDVVAAEE